MKMQGVQFGLVNVRVLANLTVKTLQCFEVMTLVRIVKRLPKVQILQFITLTRTRCR